MPPTPADGDPLVIRRLEFLGGMVQAGGWRPAPDLPEVAFVGRSNVGKSSLLNLFVGNSKLARVSRTPGRTREVNFFRVNDAFVLADLPGYGYAQASKEMRAAWRPLIEEYLDGSPKLRGVVLLLDARREPSDDDLIMRGWLGELGAPVLVAVTKIDKVKTPEMAGRTAALAKALEVDEDQVVATSAEKRIGRLELAAAIASLLEAPPWR